MSINPRPSVEEQCDLLLGEGHKEHEDIIRYGSRYKKCLWALQAIGTPEAMDAIRECTQSSDPMLREEAAPRLARVGRSAHRP